MKSLKPYREAELKKFKSGWYVEYQYIIPARLRKKGKVFKRFKVREDLNKILKTKGEEAAERYAADLIDAVNEMLRDGFNPFGSPYVAAVKREIDQEKASDINVNAALNIFIQGKKDINVAEKTIDDYESYIGIFREWLAENDLLKASILNIQTTHVESYLKYIRDMGVAMSGKVTGKTVRVLRIAELVDCF